ncbi:MAG TPA: DoxX family protein [Mycobacteriales bacterium]
MDALVLVGRIMFAALFLGSAFGHLTQTAAMAGYAASKKVPYPAAMVAGSGVLLAVGGLSVALGVWADLGSLLLVAFLLPTALLMHRFWTETDPAVRQNDQAHFNKDIALAGAGLIMFAFFAHVGHDLGLTLTGPLFSLD